MLSPEPAGQLAKSEEIVLALQRGILLGERPVGSWLRHEALAKEFDTSRTPVREALRALQSRGIVTIVKNRGARINGQSSQNVRELGEVRAELEGLAAALAAERINDDEIERMEAAWRDFDLESRTDDRGRRWAESNDQFHATILEASGNRQLYLSIQDIHGRLPPNTSYPAYAESTVLLRRNVNEHARVAEAIVSGDADLARELMKKHILGAVEAIIRAKGDSVFQENDV
ncbi:GntR family transcriptional regulator [Prauserella cavernicola]|uniref:GntR family transcriptional regulator n=1 Tax=Prauserella cavernicola TaxID=2800127 RepID=A0A934V7Z4_9PSEU|nr:GntR family transcriptional regulator [Prauserella cavernicola]MBK1787213.1 GntR family transcriptional regulator [Prauserella cavernicola]